MSEGNDPPITERLLQLRQRIREAETELAGLVYGSADWDELLRRAKAVGFRDYRHGVPGGYVKRGSALIIAPGEDCESYIRLARRHAAGVHRDRLHSEAADVAMTDPRLPPLPRKSKDPELDLTDALVGWCVEAVRAIAAARSVEAASPDVGKQQPTHSPAEGPLGGRSGNMPGETVGEPSFQLDVSDIAQESADIQERLTAYRSEGKPAIVRIARQVVSAASRFLADIRELTVEDREGNRDVDATPVAHRLNESRDALAPLVRELKRATLAVHVDDFDAWLHGTVDPEGGERRPPKARTHYRIGRFPPALKTAITRLERACRWPLHNRRVLPYNVGRSVPAWLADTLAWCVTALEQYGPSLTADEELCPHTKPSDSGDEDARQLAEQAAEPNAIGYVVHATDESAYVPATEIVSKHTPAEMPLTVKQLTPILEDYAVNRVRWTRPAGKDGKPRPNRRNVHLTDWLAYVERRRAGGFAADYEGWPVVPKIEIADRTDAIRRQKSGRK